MSSANTSQRTRPNRVLAELGSLMTRNIQGKVKLLNRLGAIVGEATRELCAGPSDRSLPKGNELFSRWVDLNLTYYSLVSHHSIAFCEDLLDAAERTLLKPISKTAEYAAPAPQIEITLNARVGEVAIAPFVVENHLTNVVSASFRVRDLVSLTGHVISADAIEFDPPQLLLQPKEQAVIKSKITINDKFRVGESYLTVLTVLGFQAREIALLITIFPGSVETPPQAATVVKRKKPRARKKRKEATKAGPS